MALGGVLPDTPVANVAVVAVATVLLFAFLRTDLSPSDAEAYALLWRTRCSSPGSPPRSQESRD